MRKLRLSLALAGALIYAQQGHPLVGTWSGDWGANPVERNQLTMVLNWDGKQVSGVMNPGPDSAPVGGVYVDPATWTIRIEADTKDKAGKAVHVSAEGRVEDIGSYHRTIAGTWRQGDVKGDFKLTRD